MNKIKSIVTIGLVATVSVLLSGCGKKTAKITPTPVPEAVEIELKAEDKPNISLVPREDGHMLKLKVSKIPAMFTQMEYEVIYKAVDQGNEIEKGVGDTIKEIKGGIVEKDILLGTESCTNGCKYKYDEGIESGSVNLTLISEDGKLAILEAPFIIRSTAEIKKAGGWEMEDGFAIRGSAASNEYFVVIKNTGLNGNNASLVYSVFSSGSGKGKINSISPESISKTDKTLIKGDYLQN